MEMQLMISIDGFIEYLEIFGYVLIQPVSVEMRLATPSHPI
jgi:hypothetical protein